MPEQEFKGGVHPSSRNPEPAGGQAAAPEPAGAESSQWERDRGINVALIDEFPLRRASTLNLLRCHLRDGARSFASVAELLSHVSLKPENLRCIIVCVGGRSVTKAPWAEDLLRLGIALSSTPVIVLSDREESEEVAAAFQRGARGYIPTSLQPSLAIEALRIVLAGGTFLPADALVRARRKAQPEVRPQMISAPAAQPREQWPPRQLAVLRLLMQGKANKEIAHALTMEEGKVKVHIGLIMRRLGANNRTQAALRARQIVISVAQDERSASSALTPDPSPALTARLGETAAATA